MRQQPSSDIGTGSETVLAQIAAEELGVGMGKIVVYSSDTDITPFDSGAYASSTTYTTGNAVIEAAKEMKRLIVEYGGRYFDTTASNVVFDGQYITKTDDGLRISLKDFCMEITYNMLHTQLTATGSFVPKKAAPPYMAGFAEVEVDLETGKVNVVDFVGVVDCGTPINPKLATVQAEGGILQGIGLALFEEVKYSKEGRLMTDSFMEYKIPARRDGANILVEFAPGYDKTGPYGAKSIGEVVINTVAPAITDAIYNACKVRIRELPVTPEKVFTAYWSHKANI